MLSASSAISEGDDQKAEALMIHARRLDPRSVPARTWLFNLYLRQERFKEAVDEAHVLFRLDAALEAPLSRTLAILAQLEDVRALILRRFARTPYLDAILRAVPSGQFDEQILVELAAQVEPRSRVDAQTRVIADLLSRKDFEATSRALASFGGQAAAAGYTVQDGLFTGDEAPSPFAWSLVANSDVRAERVSDVSSRPSTWLRVERFGSVSAIAARQSLLVRPGTYRLSHLVKAGDQQSASGPAQFTWAITCPDLPKASLATLAVNPRSGSWAETAWTIQVPSGCPMIELALASTATDFSVRADLLITRVRLDRVGR
jgi:hypothetical protein